MAHRIIRFTLATLVFILTAISAEAAPLTLTKSFNVPFIRVGGTATITFVITNSDPFAHIPAR